MGEVFTLFGHGRETQRINCHHNLLRPRGADARPVAHGANAAHAFDVIAPSLRGFVFSVEAPPVPDGDEAQRRSVGLGVVNGPAGQDVGQSVEVARRLGPLVTSGEATGLGRVGAWQSNASARGRCSTRDFALPTNRRPGADLPQLPPG